MNFEEKKEKLFSMMTTVSKLEGMHSRVKESFPDTLRNVESVWRGEKTPKGNPRKLPDNPRNNYKLDTAIPMYESLLRQAETEIKQSLDRAIAL